MKNFYYLNQEWVKRVVDNLGQGQIIIPTLKEGESISYVVNSFAQADILWKSVELSGLMAEFNMLSIYNAHNFWPYVVDRKESEQRYYGSISNGRKVYFVIGSSEPLDVQFKKSHEGENFKINLEPGRSFDPRVHVTVAGDFIISVKLKKADSDHIDQIYTSNKPLSWQVQSLETVLGQETKIRFKIERNNKKADRLKATLLKNFYVRSLCG